MMWFFTESLADTCKLTSAGCVLILTRCIYCCSAKDDPVAFINWEPAVGITRSRRSIRPGEASEAPSSRDTFKPKPKIGPFGYIGVSRLNDEKRRFVAHLQCGDELRRVPGLFESPVEAALAYDEYARRSVDS